MELVCSAPASVLTPPAHADSAICGDHYLDTLLIKMPLVAKNYQLEQITRAARIFFSLVCMYNLIPRLLCGEFLHNGPCGPTPFPLLAQRF